MVETSPPRTFANSPRARRASSQTEVKGCDRGSAAGPIRPTAALLVGANWPRSRSWVRPSMVGTPARQDRRLGLDASGSYLPGECRDRARGVHARCTRGAVSVHASFKGPGNVFVIQNPILTEAFPVDVFHKVAPRGAGTTMTQPMGVP